VQREKVESKKERGTNTALKKTGEIFLEQSREFVHERTLLAEVGQG